MIARYPGLCVHYKKPIEPGRDHYDTQSRKSYHAACAETSEPRTHGRDDDALAAELGFVHIREGEPIPADWILRRVLPADRGDAAGRKEPASHSRQKPSLFGKEAQ